jgi:hypothetical protein
VLRELLAAVEEKALEEETSVEEADHPYRGITPNNLYQLMKMSD